MTNHSDVTVFICGSALRGQPDHGNLQDAEFMGTAITTPDYRLHSVKDGYHPGIFKVPSDGIAITGELYRLTAEQYAYLESTEPPDMYPAEVTLAGGGTAIAMLYPETLIAKHQWPDISEYGGWIAYKARSV